MLNEGMFAGTGGWVLKPPGYRNENCSQRDTITSVGQATAVAHKTLDLIITVFAAQDIPLPDSDDKPDGLRPYVKCELHVETSEERTGEPIKGKGRVKEGEYKRKTKSRKTTHPDFKGETLEFIGVPGVVEELTFLR